MNSEFKPAMPKFLLGGGEMGRIINDKDWSCHPLGAIEHWPLALKLSISSMLKTAFPKFLLWGVDFYCFYNDAYRPSLGVEGKHPTILGQKFDMAWPELSNTMKLEVDRVWSTGKATWHENQLVPIYRNGKLEDVYWTFSYSALLGEDMEIAGILITCIETTESIKNLKKLEESEDQLKFAIDAAELGTWDYNPLTDKFFGNDRLKEWFGIRKEEEVALPIAIEAIVPEDQKRVKLAIEKALSGVNLGKYDITYCIKNKLTGERKNVRALGRAWFKDDREVYRFNGTLQDITEQVRSTEELRIANEAIRAERTRFKNIIENAPVGIALFNGQSPVMQMANQALFEILDRKSDQIIGKELFKALPEVQEQVAPLFKELNRKKKAVKGTEFMVPMHRKGKVQDAYFDFILHPLSNQGSSEIEIMLVANEVTDYVVARNVLSENENQFRNLVMQSPIAMAIFRGEELRIEMANNRILNHFWQRKWEDVEGKRLVDVFPELKDQKYIGVLEEVLNSGKPAREKDSKAIVITNDEHHEFYVDYDYLPLRELDGSVSGIIITVIDVTDKYMAKQKLFNFSRELENQVNERTYLLQKANLELEQSVKKLEIANEELESFAFVSSHDLQEPLRKIQMYISLITEGDWTNGKMPSNIRKYFDKISVAATRMRSLIDDLLSFSRTDVQKSEVCPTDLNKIVREVLEDLSERIELSGASVSYEGLPVIQAVPFQMRQVFDNLLNNSLKFIKPETIPEIRISTELATNKEIKKLGLAMGFTYHKIKVMDNGIGLPKGMEDKIFKVFHRLHSKTEYEGTGIGLAIVKKLVKNHQGAIYAQSQQNCGTTFALVLPENLNLKDFRMTNARFLDS
ncbi:PAS domain-containing protein [Maribacter sp. 4G9]|uniref:PAS domain-containing protein n=1 Tax=Maribacter sp. 4G9 TaxID=1889777 RepID=UPI000C15DA1A|nr:PAS domain-containing protein [Maribacter sp. 4G9]PIB30430.1 hypothetical protein BFP75_02515 [Maribacter sp. 4G9]